AVIGEQVGIIEDGLGSVKCKHIRELVATNRLLLNLFRFILGNVWSSPRPTLMRPFRRRPRFLHARLDAAADRRLDLLAVESRAGGRPLERRLNVPSFERAAGDELSEGERRAVKLRVALALGG